MVGGMEEYGEPDYTYRAWVFDNRDPEDPSLETDPGHPRETLFEALVEGSGSSLHQVHLEVTESGPDVPDWVKSVVSVKTAKPKLWGRIEWSLDASEELLAFRSVAFPSLVSQWLELRHHRLPILSEAAELFKAAQDGEKGIGANTLTFGLQLCAEIAAEAKVSRSLKRELSSVDHNRFLGVLRGEEFIRLLKHPNSCLSAKVLVASLCLPTPWAAAATTANTWAHLERALGDRVDPGGFQCEVILRGCCGVPFIEREPSYEDAV
jgi:hypothetical protein